jgi:glycerol-3-phosphate cytidylyltransferase
VTTGLTFGVFDLFHIGHLNFLKKCKVFCDYLIICVHDDIDRSSNKPAPFYNIEERVDFVTHLKLADEVRVYTRVDIAIIDISFDILFYGPDQNHKYFSLAFDICDREGKQRKIIERTPNISTSSIRKTIL